MPAYAATKGMGYIESHALIPQDTVALCFVLCLPSLLCVLALVLQASFRGRPLQGKSLSLPPGYTGALIVDQGKTLSSAGLFSQFVLWGLQDPPSPDSRLVKALQWTAVAPAVSATTRHGLCS